MIFDSFAGLTPAFIALCVGCFDFVQDYLFDVPCNWTDPPRPPAMLSRQLFSEINCELPLLARWGASH